MIASMLRMSSGVSGPGGEAVCPEASDVDHGEFEEYMLMEAACKAGISELIAKLPHGIAVGYWEVSSKVVNGLLVKPAWCSCEGRGCCESPPTLSPTPTGS